MRTVASEPLSSSARPPEAWRARRVGCCCALALAYRFTPCGRQAEHAGCRVELVAADLAVLIGVELTEEVAHTAVLAREQLDQVLLQRRELMHAQRGASAGALAPDGMADALHVLCSVGQLSCAVHKLAMVLLAPLGAEL